MLTRFAVPLALVLASAVASAQDNSTAQYQTPQGELTVHSGQPQPQDYGPPPPFAQLDANKRGFLTSTEADAYPPLANDFIHADANRDGKVSRAEYERWASHQ